MALNDFWSGEWKQQLCSRNFYSLFQASQKKAKVIYCWSFHHCCNFLLLLDRWELDSPSQKEWPAVAPYWKKWHWQISPNKIQHPGILSHIKLSNSPELSFNTEDNTDNANFNVVKSSPQLRTHSQANRKLCYILLLKQFYVSQQ